MKKAILISALILAPLTAAHADLITLPNEPDVCSNIEGHQYPAPSGWHAEADGTCTELQAPVTIDVTPAGGQSQTIDVTPSGGSSQTIDVNPRSSSGTQSVSVGATTLTQPSTITNVNDLATYTFNPNATEQEKVAILQARLVQLLVAMIQQLQAQLATMQ